jgi:hypothetical protein
VAGFTTSNVWPSAASTASPPITIRAVVGVVAAAADGSRWSVVIGRNLVGGQGDQEGGETPLVVVGRWYAG